MIRAAFIDRSHFKAFKSGRESQWLAKRGFDGLYSSGECACENRNLYPCGERQDCKPGMKLPCDPETCAADGHCDWHIGPKEVAAQDVKP